MPYRVTEIDTKATGSWNDMSHAEEMAMIVEHGNLDNILVMRKLWVGHHVFVESETLSENDTVRTSVYIYSDEAMATMARDLVTAEHGLDYKTTVITDPERLIGLHEFFEPPVDYPTDGEADVTGDPLPVPEVREDHALAGSDTMEALLAERAAIIAAKTA